MALLKALCWALIFIIRIRFPPGTSLATVLNNRYNNEALQAFRKFQRLYRSMLKLKPSYLDAYDDIILNKANHGQFILGVA